MSFTKTRTIGMFLSVCLLMIVSLNVVQTHAVSSLPPICCVPDQFEAVMYGSQGATNTDLSEYGYINGTVLVVYDWTNQRSYMSEDITVWLSIYPTYTRLNVTYIYDYAKNIQYDVYSDGTCDTGEIDEPMYRECIPGNATLVSEGIFGDFSVKVKTYRFTNMVDQSGTELTASVVHSAAKPEECIPVYSILSTSSDSYVADLTGVSVMDFIPVIKDTSIFIPPKSCSKTPNKKSSTNRFTKRTRRFHLFGGFGKTL